MNTKAIARRVARLEQHARTIHAAYIQSLTDDEFDAFYNAIPADTRAELERLTDAELERLAAGRMPRHEWQHLQRHK